MQPRDLEQLDQLEDRETSKSKDYDELLSFMGLDTRDLSSQADGLLTQMAEYKRVLNLRAMDPMSVHCWYTDLQMEKMELEPYILALEQNIQAADRQIEADRRNLEKFKNDLKQVKDKIAKDMSEEEFQKKKRSNDTEIKTYEEKLDGLEGKLAKCHIPGQVLPESMRHMKIDVDNACKKRNQMKSAAHNISLAKSAKKDLLGLKCKDFN
ncbi:uncharacterized protein LOC143918979 [Arctopsyche grandis]|uniref:uncharacterized protein LOC143918979 n=1 Tax=Arctopsyche grandis TaxID=121162 RepID=UPI00406D89F8